MNWEDLAEQVLYLKQSQKLYAGELSNFFFFAHMNQIKRTLVAKASLFWANKEYLCIISSGNIYIIGKMVSIGEDFSSSHIRIMKCKKLVK